MSALSVSCIVPAFNAEIFLAHALDSVRALEHPELEVIVVDDGSTDRTAHIAGNTDGVRLVHQENAGPSAARNHGIRLAEGDIIAFLDADDLFPPNRLDSVARFDDEPPVDLVQGLVQDLDGSGSGPETFEVAGVDPYRFVNIGSWLFRRTVFDQVGGFDENLDHLEDVDWFFRAWDLGVPKADSAEIALFYRRYEGSLSFGKPSHELGLARVLRRHLKRQREGRVVEPAQPFLDYVGRLPPERRPPVVRQPDDRPGPVV